MYSFLRNTAVSLFEKPNRRDRRGFDSRNDFSGGDIYLNIKIKGLTLN
jgi:hypothetical protein